MDRENLTPTQIADHLAKLIASPLPKKVKGVKKKGKPLGRPRKSRPAPSVPLSPTVTIHLFGLHRINGFPYGPGTVTVTRELASTLQENDQRARQYDDNWQRPKAVIVGPRSGQSGHKVQNVSPALFDSPSLNIPEMGFAHGDGNFTNT